MKDQAAKLVGRLQVAVDSLDDLEPLRPKLSHKVAAPRRRAAPGNWER